MNLWAWSSAAHVPQYMSILLLTCGAPEDARGLTPGTWEYATLHGEGEFADGADFRFLRREAYLGFSGWADVVTGFPKGKEGDRRVTVHGQWKQLRSERFENASLLASQVKEGPRAKECR